MRRFTFGDEPMSGKGSKRRPFAVSNKEQYIETRNNFDRQWDIIFGGKNMKHEKDQTYISTYRSEDGERIAEVRRNEDGYYVEFYLNEEYVKVVDVSAHSIHFAEDIAENYVLGIINPKESTT